MTDRDPDFARHYLQRVEAIKYRLSAGEVLGFQCEIFAAEFVRNADDDAYSRLDQTLESLQYSDSDCAPLACLAAKGAVENMREKGITKDNVKDYMDRRILEFEETARSRKR